ncbi:hypothetical protein Tco_0525576 [Tanacetum coccineum]
MDKIRSFMTHNKHQELYDALLNSVCLDEAIASDPRAGLDKKKKRSRKGKDFEPSKYKVQTGSSKGKTPPKTSKPDKSVTTKESVEELIHEAAMDVEEPILDDVVNDADQP